MEFIPNFHWEDAAHFIISDMSSLSYSRAGGSKKSQRLNGVINITGQKEFEVSFMAESTRIMTSASNVASGLENNNRDLIDKNVQLKGALANTYSKVIETLRYFYSILKKKFFSGLNLRVKSQWKDLREQPRNHKSSKTSS